MINLYSIYFVLHKTKLNIPNLINKNYTVLQNINNDKQR